MTANITSENISVIDRMSGELEKIIRAGSGVEGMVFTPDGKYLWAINKTGGSILVIDWARREVIEEFECKGMPVRIVFTEDGKKALVAGWTKKDTLTVIDVKSKKEIKRIPVGDYAIGLETSPDGRYAFVGCEDSVDAKVLPGGSERK